MFLLAWDQLERRSESVLMVWWVRADVHKDLPDTISHAFILLQYIREDINNLHARNVKNSKKYMNIALNLRSLYLLAVNWYLTCFFFEGVRKADNGRIHPELLAP